MCLAVPGRLIEIVDSESAFAAGLVEFAGIRRKVNLACVPNARPDDYVLVHAGVAISCIDADEAAKVLATLNELELVEDFEA
jgi:hydrogenase expression/formation protein HypC